MEARKFAEEKEELLLKKSQDDVRIQEFNVSFIKKTSYDFFYNVCLF